MQQLLAQVSLLDNPFGIDDTHLTVTAEVIEQKLAAMKEQTAAVVAKDGDALQQMHVAQESLLSTRLPESPDLSSARNSLRLVFPSKTPSLSISRQFTSRGQRP